MICRLDKRSDDYKHCGSCPYLTCPCNKKYLARAIAKRKEKFIGKLVIGFTFENVYVGVLLSIETTNRDGKVKFKIQDERKIVRRCTSIYYKKEVKNVR